MTTPSPTTNPEAPSPTTSGTASTRKTSAFSRLSKQKKVGILIAVIVVIVIALLMRSGWLVAATVNGKPVSRLSVIHQLEQANGPAALDVMITYALIEQEAKAKDLSVTDEEIANELETLDQNLKTQGQSLDQALAAEGISREDIEPQIRAQKAIEKMVGEIKVTDEDVNAFMETNKASLPEGIDATELREQVRTQIEQEKRNSAAQQLISELRTKATIKYYGTYQPTQPVTPPTPPAAETVPQE
ncbi:MAG: SurA N-terminal domain-containing protein [Candidatus Andersenbacteria bacterium]